MENKVTICIQSYNHEKYIEKCIQSLLNQNYRNFNIIVFDDCSNDRSVEIINKFQKKSSKIKLIITKTPLNQTNFNEIILRSNEFGDYFTIFHSDDMYQENILNEQVKYMNKNKEILAVGTSAWLINDISNKVGKVKLPNELKTLSIIDKKKFIDLIFKYGFFLMTPSFMYRTSFFINKKLFYNYSKFGWAADVGFFYKLLEYGKIGFINKELLNYRISDVSTSQILKNTKVSKGDLFKVLEYCLKNENIDQIKKYKLKKKMDFLLMHEITICNINRAIKDLTLIDNKYISNIIEGFKNLNNFKKLFFSVLIKIFLNFPYRKKILIEILKIKNKK